MRQLGFGHLSPAAAVATICLSYADGLLLPGGGGWHKPFSFPLLRTDIGPMHGSGLACSEALWKRSLEIYTRLQSRLALMSHPKCNVTPIHSFYVLETGVHSTFDLAMNPRMTLNSLSPASTSQM